jgi:DNA polymerase III alpha subunit (gram-positive type)
VAHNAGFDITFLNGELASAAKRIATERVVDTLCWRGASKQLGVKQRTVFAAAGTINAIAHA